MKYPHPSKTLVITCLLALAGTLFRQSAAAAGLNTAAIDAALGRSGQMLAGDVYKVGFPRKDLHVVIDGIEIKPGLALGSYAVFKQYGSSALMMGDLVLLPSEVEGVMKALELSGIRSPRSIITCSEPVKPCSICITWALAMPQSSRPLSAKPSKRQPLHWVPSLLQFRRKPSGSRHRLNRRSVTKARFPAECFRFRSRARSTNL